MPLRPRATGNYTRQTGSLRVTITPAAAVEDGAQWNVDGGTWHNNGDTQDGLSVGEHTVAFRSIAGWTRPGNQSVSIANEGTATASGNYTVAIPDAPVLLEPGEGEVMDNGCSDKTDPIEWDFKWERVPGAIQYHLYVIGPTASIPAIDIMVSDTTYRDLTYGNIVDVNRFEWRWHVRAMNRNQQWGKWSEWRYFNVEPMDTDCPD